MISKADILKLEQAIKSGMIDGYQTSIAYKLSRDNFQSKALESLLAQKTAAAIYGWNSNFIYSLEQEYFSKHFINNAFIPQKDVTPPGSDLLFGTPTILKRLKHIPLRGPNGKIDLVICLKNELDDTEYPLVGIEFKAINGRVSLILDDIDRLSHAMFETDPVGDNHIQICYSAFLLNSGTSGKGLKEADIVDLKDELKKEWENRLINHKVPAGIKLEVELFDVQQGSLDTAGNHQPPDADWSDVISETGLVVGMLIRISRI